MSLGLTEVIYLCRELDKSPVKVAHAASVIYAESGGNPTARCYNYRDPRTGKVTCYPGHHDKSDGPPPAGTPILSIDRGICQWNDKWHPEISTADADDARKAIKHMYYVSHQFTNFSAWAANGTTRQKNYEKQALSILGDITLPPGFDDPSPTAAAVGAVGGVLYNGGKGIGKAVTSIPDALALLTNPKTWTRVLEVVVGAVAIVIGAFLLDRSLVSQALGSAVTSTVGGIATKVGT